MSKFYQSIVILCFLSLAGCKTTGALEKKDIKNVPDVADLEACITPGGLKGGEFEEVLLKLDETLNLLKACKTKHGNLVEYVSKK